MIYADPPWRYSAKRACRGRRRKHYPTMGIDELCTLPVADLAAPDSVLFVDYVPAAPGGPAAHQGVGLSLTRALLSSG